MTDTSTRGDILVALVFNPPLWAAGGMFWLGPRSSDDRIVAWLMLLIGAAYVLGAVYLYIEDALHSARRRSGGRVLE